MAAQPHFRDVREDDLASIEDLERSAFGEVACQYSVLKQFFLGQKRHWLVAEGSDGVWANSMCLVEGAAALLFGFCVHPAHQREGIGTKLMELTLDRLRASRVSEVRLTVKPTNHHAIHLFKSAGFEPEGDARPDFLGPDHPRIVMTARLAAP